VSRARCRFTGLVNVTCFPKKEQIEEFIRYKPEAFGCKRLKAISAAKGWRSSTLLRSTARSLSDSLRRASTVTDIKVRFKVERGYQEPHTLFERMRESMDGISILWRPNSYFCRPNVPFVRGGLL
jgi:hypothetical protein